MTHIDLVPNPWLRRRDLVQKWLEDTGWLVTDLNYGKRIPIVARKGSTIIFVTVHPSGTRVPSRTRQYDIAAAGAQWVATFGKSGTTYRFDTATFDRERADVRPPFSYKEDAWRSPRGSRSGSPRRS